jgi:hypothetical protein
VRRDLAQRKVIERGDHAQVGIGCSKFQARGQIEHVVFIPELIDLQRLGVLVARLGLGGKASELAVGSDEGVVVLPMIALEIGLGKFPPIAVERSLLASSI